MKLVLVVLFAVAVVIEAIPVEEDATAEELVQSINKIAGQLVSAEPEKREAAVELLLSARNATSPFDPIAALINFLLTAIDNLLQGGADVAEGVVQGAKGVVDQAAGVVVNVTNATGQALGGAIQKAGTVVNNTLSGLAKPAPAQNNAIFS